MTLLELLIKKLPQCAGWPKDAARCIYHEYKEGATFYDVEGAMVKNGVGFIDLCIPDVRIEEVTREQYEAALAASKPEWDGEGLPPVGCRVEANYGGEWVEAMVAYTDRPEAHGDAVAWKEALVFDCKTTRPFWADEFRPIRSEADKKKYGTIEKMLSIFFSAPPVDEPNENDRVAMAELYDAIRSGKIIID